MRNNPPVLAALFCAGLLAASSAHGASLPPPHIGNATFTDNGDGTYNASITGSNFGPIPSDIPCTACAPLEMQVVDLATQPQRQSINVTSWSDTLITVTGITATAGDAMRMAVYNATAANADAWGGRVSHADNVPYITSIEAIPQGRNTIITITGKGFGPAPQQVGQTTTSPYLVLSTFNRQNVNGDGFPWNGGFCGTNDCNAVTAAYTSWTDTQVVISGFGKGTYGGGENNDWKLKPHDTFCVGIWSSANQGNGTTGGTTRCIRLRK